MSPLFVFILLILVVGICAIFVRWLYRHDGSESTRMIYKPVLMFITTLLAAYQLGSCTVFRLQLLDARQIDTRYLEFNRAISEGSTNDAYLLMSPSYRKDNSFSEFVEGFGGSGPLPELNPLRSLRISRGTALLYPYSDGQTSWSWSGLGVLWEKIDGEWFLTGEIEYFVD